MAGIKGWFDRKFIENQIYIDIIKENKTDFESPNFGHAPEWNAFNTLSRKIDVGTAIMSSTTGFALAYITPRRSLLARIPFFPRAVITSLAFFPLATMSNEAFFAGERLQTLLQGPEHIRNATFLKLQHRIPNHPLLSFTYQTPSHNISKKEGVALENSHEPGSDSFERRRKLILQNADKLK